eukprot:Seg1769.7 transcript_id=Seg1769.7/GoldUCD/mRNA.D3Y31 product="putative protein C1orf189" protein_id=Seg1769.7/GoldUCD/D3Y31
MSLLATSYRFECKSGNAKAHKKALERQEASIKELEEQSVRSKEEAADKRAYDMAKWIENFEEAGQTKKVVREIKEIGEELRFAGKGLNKVRQAQLKDLLDGEQKQYADELASLGKAFYVERI